MEKTKLLSIVIPVRNDDFHGNFRWRCETMLNYTAAVLDTLKVLDEVCIEIVDWGSPTPFVSGLTLTEEVVKITRTMVVPAARAAALNGESVFNLSLAMNVGIRRAYGRFIMATDADVLIPPQTMRTLLEKIVEEDLHHAGGVNGSRFGVYYAPRRHVPYQVVSKSPPVKFIAQLIEYAGETFHQDPLVCFCPTSFKVMHAAMWDNLRGHGEDLPYWGWMDADLFMRAAHVAQFHDLWHWGCVGYHLEHYPPGGRDQLQRRVNPCWINRPLFVNEENWGAEDEMIEGFALKAESEKKDEPENCCEEPASHHEQSGGTK